jgi:hypothetical protein
MYQISDYAVNSLKGNFPGRRITPPKKHRLGVFYPANRQKTRLPGGFYGVNDTAVQKPQVREAGGAAGHEASAGSRGLIGKLKQEPLIDYPEIIWKSL